MKRFLLLIIVMMFTGITSCAEKKEKKTQIGFSSDPYNASTLEGHFNPAQNSQAPVLVGGVQYQLSSQTNPMIVYGSLQQSTQMNQIQPVMVNGVPMYRARITGYVNVVNTQVTQANYPNQYQNQYPQQQQISPYQILTITAIQFY